MDEQVKGPWFDLELRDGKASSNYWSLSTAEVWASRVPGGPKERVCAREITSDDRCEGSLFLGDEVR